MSLRLADFLRASEKKLSDACIDRPGFDARFLIGQALGLDRGELFSQADRILTEEERHRAQALIDRRANYEPVGRIMGEREFWGLTFHLNEATLEPRPDSEILIETTLRYLPQKDAPLQILDLGTGSGCLLLSVLHEFPNAKGLGLDIAPRAVEQANKNAEHLGLQNRATFKVNNWLEGIKGPFDLILANPPYIEQQEIPALMPEVRDYDPLAALDGGIDGLVPYRLLIPQLPKLMSKGGLAVFEVGYNQAASVSALFHANGFAQIEQHKDLGGIERCITAHIP